MSIKTHVRLFAFCFALMGMTPVNAQECSCPKLGFINTERVYRETNQAKEITARLQQEFEPRRTKIEVLKIKGLKLQSKLQSEKLSTKQRQSLLKEYRELKRQYQLEQVGLTEEYSLRRNEEFAALQRKANQVILNIKETEGYDWIDDEAVLVDSKYDITDKVIKGMNEQ